RDAKCLQFAAGEVGLVSLGQVVEGAGEQFAGADGIVEVARVEAAGQQADLRRFGIARVGVEEKVVAERGGLVVLERVEVVRQRGLVAAAERDGAAAVGVGLEQGAVGVGGGAEVVGGEL